MKKITLLFILLSSVCFAQMGTIDPTFNAVPAGTGTGTDDAITSAVRQPDGKFLVIGGFNYIHGNATRYLARLNADGTLDTTFAPGNGLNSKPLGIALQPDGKILLVGNFTNYNGTAVYRIMRLNADASLDTSFNPGTGPNSAPSALLLQPDGKMMISGLSITSYNGTAINHILRINADGSLDTTFNPGGTTNSEITTIVRQPDGKYLFGGFFTTIGGNAVRYIARLNTNGTLDTTFTPGTGPNSAVHGIGLKSNGKIVIGGRFSSYNGTANIIRVAQLNANGTLDTGVSFGAGPNSSVFSLALTSDEKIMIGGNFNQISGTNRYNLARLNANGSVDTSFDIGTSNNSAVNFILPQDQGRVIVAGNFLNLNNVSRKFFARLDSDGSVDETFYNMAGANNTIYTHASQPDGKILIGGAMSAYGNTLKRWIARINADGSLDDTFVTSANLGGEIRKIVVLPSGKILIAGSVTSTDGTVRNGIVRLNADGSTDTTFDPSGSGTSGGMVADMALTPDGKIVIAGDFSFYNNVYTYKIARLNADGTLDPAFQAFPNATIRKVCVQPDGKVLIAGQFTTVGLNTSPYVARYNADGTFDSTFNIGTGPNNMLLAIDVQTDGKILISGTFTQVQGTAIPYLARLNSDGTLDASFVSPATTWSRDILAQQDGGILYMSNNGSVARVLASGAADESFYVGSGAAAYEDISLDADDNILISGNFTWYNGTEAGRIVRLKGLVPPALSVGSLASSLCAGQTLDVPFTTQGVFSASNTFTAELSDASGNFENAVAIGSVEAVESGVVQAVVPVEATGSAYRIRVRSNGPELVSADNGSDITVTAPVLFYADTDADNFGDASNSILACTQPEGYVANSSDCNDSDFALNQQFSFYMDADADGYGTGESMPVCAANAQTAPLGYAVDGSDCDDTDATVHASFAFYTDADLDGYGTGETVLVCAVDAVTPPSGFATNNNDCNDSQPIGPEIPYNGLDDDCDGTIDEGSQVFSQVLPAQCGITLNSLSTAIGAVSYSATDEYRFKVVNSATLAEQVIERNVPHFRLTQLANYDYATTYTISVQLKRNGIWLNYYGPACQVSTPAILSPGGPAAVDPSQCGMVLPSISTLIATTSLYGVSAYRFRITDTETGVQQVIDRNYHWFSLTMLPSYLYGRTYTVEVAVKTNGQFSGYGQGCQVTSPEVPSLANCGAMLATMSSLVYTTSLNRVTSYRFQLTNLATLETTLIDRSQHYFSFGSVPGFSAGGQYAISVAVMTAGAWSGFGEACTITAPGAARSHIKEDVAPAVAFRAVVYPNPYSESFAFDMDTDATDNVSVRIYDMIGKLVEHQEIAVDAVEVRQFGERYPSGVYTIVLSQGASVRTLRVIKR